MRSVGPPWTLCYFPASTNPTPNLPATSGQKLCKLQPVDATFHYVESTTHCFCGGGNFARQLFGGNKRHSHIASGRASHHRQRSRHRKRKCSYGHERF